MTQVKMALVNIRLKIFTFIWN